MREIGCVWKTVYINPLKLKIRVFCRLASREVTCKKCLWSTKLFAGKHYLRDSCESFCLKFCVFTFCLYSFSREVLSRELLAKIPLKKFLIKNMKQAILNKNSKHESIKTLSKTYKILKKNFGFDWQAIEYTHHIWTCTHKWNKYSLNQKSCVLCVSIKCEIVLSPEWRFND